MEKSISYIIGNPQDFWASDITAQNVLPIMKPIVELLNGNGYEDIQVIAGGGVDERDTGYKSFYAKYSSFKECEERLVSDFQNAEKEKLDGFWYYILNYESINIYFKNDENEAKLFYSRGELTLTCDNETIEIIKSFVDEIVLPHVWKKKS